MMFSMNFKIQCNRRLILTFLLHSVVKGEESSGSTTTHNSGWVFWYSDGSCGQYCIITFSIVGVLTFLMLLCCIWRCFLIRRHFKKDDTLRTRMNLEQDMAELETKETKETNKLSVNPYQDIIARQYPPLSKTPHNYDLPPSYSEASAAPEKLLLHGLRRNSSWQAYKEGQKFNQETPPLEILPPPDHIKHIIALGRPKAWKINLEEIIRNNNLANVSDNGLVVQFSGAFDKMVQTNYPLFRPYETGPDSMTGSQPLPAYGDSHSEWFYYYEITVLSIPKKLDMKIAIGLATKPFPPFRLPGWHKISIGWHSDDGNRLYNESFGGKPYGDWGDIGDVIGCGYYPDTGIVFFTKNGQRLNNITCGASRIWYPTVGASDECKIEFNFGGGEKEFRYEGARGTSVAGPLIS